MSQISMPLSVNPTWLPPACTLRRCCRGKGYCPDCALMPCFLESQILHLPYNTKVNVNGDGVGVTVQTVL